MSEVFSRPGRSNADFFPLLLRGAPSKRGRLTGKETIGAKYRRPPQKGDE